MIYQIACDVESVNQIAISNNILMCAGDLHLIAMQDQILSLSSLDPAQTAAFFTAGFGIFALFFMVGQGIGPIIRLVKRA